MFNFFKRKKVKESITYIVLIPKDKINQFYKLYDSAETYPVKRYQFELWSFVEESICKETVEKLLSNNPECKTHTIKYELDIKDITHPAIKITVFPEV